MKFHFRRSQVYIPLVTRAILLANLSLFFMLLAFFIALNGMSIVNNHRYRSVVESVYGAFSVNIVPTGLENGLSVSASPDQSFMEGDTLMRIDGLFNAQITGFKADTSRRGVMHISLPLDELDRALKAADQVDLTKVKSVTGLQTYFLPTLVSLLKTAPQEQSYRMDIILHSKDTPSVLQNSDPAALKDIMARAASYADLFTKTGMASPNLTIGISRGDPAQADMYFRPIDTVVSGGAP